MASDRPQLSFRNTDVTLFEWLWAHVLLFVPLLNVLMLLRWSFSRHTKVSLQNYARSVLLIVACLGIVGAGMWGAGLLDRGRILSWAESVRERIANIDPSMEPFLDLTPAYRTFRDQSGRSMQAMVTGFKGSKAILKRADGEVFETDIARFSNPDRDYLMELRRSMEAGPARED